MIGTLVLSAQGEQSFSATQLAQLSGATIVAVPGSIDENEFTTLAQQKLVVALTRRPQISITKKVLDELPLLRALCVYSTGLEWIDLDELKARGILCLSLEDYCSSSVAEHTIGMLLSLSRRIVLSDLKSTKIIPEHISLRGFEISNKKVGIIGLGRIGKKIAELIEPFGCSIYYYDPLEFSAPYQPTTKNELLKMCDIVVLACPYSGICEIGQTELNLMSAESVLLNPSRKDLVDTPAILDALRTKKLKGYAVDDVITQDTSKLEYGRLLQTYHTAWYSDEVLERGTQMWVDNINLAQEMVCNNE